MSSFIHSEHRLRWELPVRVTQVVFAIIILGLTAYAINVAIDRRWWPSDTVHFDLFSSVWTLLIALPYLSLVPILFPDLSHIYVVTAVEFITMVFWFGGFVALGSLLPPSRACHHSGPCRALQAATVFASFEWLLFAITLALAVRQMLQFRQSLSTSAAKPSEVERQAEV